MKIILQVVLLALIAFLGYQLYNSIIGPVKFNEERDARYEKVIRSLKDIQVSQLAYKEINGKFTGDFDSLINFIEVGQFANIQRRDTSYADQKKNRAYGLDAMTGGYILEDVLVDTLGYTPVKDSLFKNSNRYKTMMKIPVEGVDKNFDMKAGHVFKNDVKYAAFEAKVEKDVILHDMNKDLLQQEKQVVSVEGVNGPTIKVGSLDNVDTSGNWPKIYDTVKD
ncbi:hypothetical protein ULMS_17810 [Patiriisocius marinistellae]|uniref:Uncharacterized protein n=1 Tax=Patiriisocius marinistellae TaxID=2494560 RepID=A0A5J4FWC8_9FLAO|nr:hypothetical protein [Patiriisocius marinistellae]GEQ86273.1 hypothetical protein ULMS_17810 [Patiriisocius marinistellae]